MTGWWQQCQPVILGMVTKICNYNVLYSNLNSTVSSHYYSFSWNMEIWVWELGMVKRQGFTFMKSTLSHSLPHFSQAPQTVRPAIRNGNLQSKTAWCKICPCQRRSFGPQAAVMGILFQHEIHWGFSIVFFKLPHPYQCMQYTSLVGL